jgi:CheY-like chemotaxis protein
LIRVRPMSFLGDPNEDADFPWVTRMKMRIFLIEDDDMIRRALQRELRSLVADLRVFADPSPALEAAKAEPPDLLVTDYSLPNLDGVDALTAIRRSNPAVRTLLLSGTIPDEKIADAIEGGLVDRFVSKPWSHTELQEVLAKLTSLVACQAEGVSSA